MTTNLDIIKRGLKKLHVLAGGSEPTSVQAAAGMDALQGLISELIGTGVFGKMRDVIASTDYLAWEFDRIQVQSGVTITLPTVLETASAENYPFLSTYWSSMYPSFASADYGWGVATCITQRPPWDRAIIVLVSATGVETDYVWSAYKGGWQAINSLGQQDNFPFAASLENGFAAMLAERLVDEYDGGEVGAETKRQANTCRSMLSLGFDGPRRYPSQPVSGVVAA